MSWWEHLHDEVAVEFLAAGWMGRRRAMLHETVEELLWWKWHRRRLRDRAYYAEHREKRLASQHAYRRSDVGRLSYERWHARRRYVRAQSVAGLVCPECGASVAARDKGIGVRPKYCSERCSHRAASRRWWRAHRKRAA